MRIHRKKILMASLGQDLGIYRQIAAIAVLRLATQLPSSQTKRLFKERAFLELVFVGPESEISLPEDEDDDGPVVTRQLLVRRLKVLKAMPLSNDAPLFRNIAWLAQKVGLNETEQELLRLGCLFSAVPKFTDALSNIIGSLTEQSAKDFFAVMLGRSFDEVSAALSRKGLLFETGLTKQGSSYSEPLELLDGLARTLLNVHRSESELLACFFNLACPPQLAATDYAHLEQDFNMLRAYLTQALRARKKGINVLLHGEPGTGKTEFARTLAQSVGAQLYEVQNEDDEGDSISGSERFGAYRLCQRILAADHKSLVVFDEIEDVFPANYVSLGFFRHENSGERTVGKAFVNRVLETNPVPSIWISNAVTQIDPAYLRRFDYSLEIPKPPRAVRKRIADKYLAETLISSERIERIADRTNLTPAQIEKAAKVAVLCRPESIAETEQIVSRVLQHSARLLGQRESASRSEFTNYSIEYLNINLDITPVIAGLKTHPHASFCMYGPPGTGKTALARHLADAIGKPLLVKRASDILSMWVGGSEQNIAEMFREARHEGAVLVLDEADSLLSDRRNAQRSWEVTQVNEMLTQMEDFNGVFICTTNLLEHLDRASLRRFSFKIGFDYLTPVQSCGLFEQELLRLNPEAKVPQSVLNNVARIRNLTPGDFATVVRQWRVMTEKPEPHAFAAALMEECRLKEKESSSQNIGFVS